MFNIIFYSSFIIFKYYELALIVYERQCVRRVFLFKTSIFNIGINIYFYLFLEIFIRYIDIVYWIVCMISHGKINRAENVEIHMRKPEWIE